MLHLRSLSGLSDVLQSNLKRPLSCAAGVSTARCFSSSGSEWPAGRLPSRGTTPAPAPWSLRRPPAARPPQPAALTQTRALCSKSDGGGGGEASKDSAAEK